MLTLCAHWIITRLISVMLKDRWGHLRTFSKLFPSLWKIFGTFLKIPGRFPFRQNYQFNRFECISSAVRREIFRNKWATIPRCSLFLSQPVGTDIPVPFVQFCFDRRIGPLIFPAICRRTLFTHSRSFSFFLNSYLFVQNGICACTSDAKALGRFSRNTSRFLWQKQKPEFRYGTSTKREIPPPPKKKKQKTKTNSEWMRMRCKRGSVPWKPFHLTRNVSGISYQKCCLNRKGPRSWLDEKLTHLTLKKSKGTELVVHHRVAMKRVKT